MHHLNTTTLFRVVGSAILFISILSFEAVGQTNPSMDPISDVNINEDNGSVAIGLTNISDGDNVFPVGITFSEVSDDDAIIPTSSIYVDNFNSALGTANLNFTPEDDQSGTVQITVTIDDGVDTPQDYLFDVNIDPIADTPGVTDGSANEGAQTGLLPISRNANDGSEVTHFKITNITNGSLFQSDGSTGISNGDFITFAQGDAGLRFMPGGSADGSFDVQASTSSNDTGLGGSVVTATITVNDAPTASDESISTDEDQAHTFLASEFNANYSDSDPFAGIRITSLPASGSLEYNSSEVLNGDLPLDIASGSIGQLDFIPAAHAFGASYASFNFQVGDNQGAYSTNYSMTVNVDAVADTPGVTNATANQGSPNSSGLQISRNANDGAEVTHFKITNISNGSLFQNDGSTGISNGDFITYAQGNVGLKFIPSSSSNGSFDVQASTVNNDTGLGGSTVTATITVNDAPTASDESISTDEDQAHTFLASEFNNNYSDSDPFAGIRITSLPASGSLEYNSSEVLNGDLPLDIASGSIGQLDFIPAAHAFGAPYASFNFQVGDNQGAYSTNYSMTVNVDAVADTPGVTNATANQGSPNSSGLQISRNASDGAEVTHFKITNISNGSLFQNDGTTPITAGNFITYAQGNVGLKFIPGSSSDGSFDVQASTANNDTGLGGSVVTATITVNDTPTASDESISTDEDQAHTFLASEFNNNYSDSDPFAGIRITSLPASGSLEYNSSEVLNGDLPLDIASGSIGQLDFIPAAHAFGVPYASFNFQVGDNQGAYSTNYSMTVNVDAVADTPGVTNATANQGSPNSSGLQISRNANDGAEVTHFKITNISNGSLFQNDGTTPITAGNFITYAQGNAGLKFIPGSSSDGSFDVQASTANNDTGLGGSTVTATITVNDAPTASDESISTDEDQAHTFLASEFNGSYSDSDPFAGIRITSLPASGSLEYNSSEVLNGDLPLDIASGSIGQLDFIPAAHASGAPYASFNFQVGDNQGAYSTNYSMTVNVDAVADTPGVTDGSANEGAQTGLLAISRNANDGSEVTHFKITNITNGSLYQSDGSTGISNGDFITFAQGDAGLRFSPGGSADGSFDVQASTASNDAGLGGSTVTANIAVNARPTTTDITNINVNEDAPDYVINLGDVFDDAEDADTDLVFTIENNSNPSIFDNVGISGLTLTFELAPGASGSSNITVRATDTGGAFRNDSFVFTINPVNDPPTSTNKSFSMDEDDTHTFSAAQFSTGFSDPEGGPFNGIRITDLPLLGSLELDGDSDLEDEVLTVADISNLTYEPAPNEFGNNYATFRFNVRDDQGAFSTAAYDMVITVDPVNDPPTINPIADPAPIAEDANPQTVSFSNVSVGPGETSDLSQSIDVSASSNNTSLINSVSVTYNGNGTGSVSYQPLANQFGSADITVTVDDGLSTNNTRSQTFTVQVNPVADTPEVTNASTDEGQQTTTGLVITKNTNDGTEVSHYKITDIVNGNLFQTNGSTSISEGSFITAGQGAAGLRFTPNNGNQNGSFNIQASTSNNDSGLGGAIVQATITVNGVPSISTPIADINVDEDALNYTINLADIFQDAEDTDAQLTFSIENNSNPSIFSSVNVNSSQVLVFTPAPNANGASNFTIRCTDTDGAFIEESFTFTIDAVNDAPVFTLSQNTVEEDEDFGGTINVSVNPGSIPSDEISQTVTYSLVPSSVSFVDISINSNNGNITIESVPNQSGSQTFQVIASDGQSQNNTVSRNLTVTIGSVNNPPVFTLSGNITEQEDFTETLSVTVTPGAVPSDEQDQDVTYSLSPSSVAFANVSIDENTGNVLIDAVDDRFGSQVFTITADDGQSENNTFSDDFTLTIQNVDDDPTIDQVADISLTEGAGQQQVDLTGISAGPFESQGINVFASSFNTANIPQPTIVYVSPQSEGTLTFTPNEFASGATQIQVLVIDAGGRSTTMTFEVTISDKNDPPSFNTIASPIVLDEDASEQLINITGISAGPGENQALSFSVDSDNESLISDAVIDYVSPNSIGTLHFTPEANANGTANLTITLMDNGPTGGDNENTYSQTVEVTVNPVNDAPIIVSSAVTSAINGQEYVYDIVVDDPDQGEVLDFTSSTFPAWLSLTNNNDGTATLAGTPGDDDLGDNEITLLVEDDEGLADQQEFSINVANPNNIPEFISEPDTTATETLFYAYNIEVDDQDEADDLNITFSEKPAWLTLVDNDNRSGILEGTPPEGSEGEYNVSLSVSDGSGGVVDQVFTLYVEPFNNAPRLNHINIATTEDISYEFTARMFKDRFFDADGDTLVHIVIVSLPADGILMLGEDEVSEGDIINVNDIGNLVYIPDPDFNDFDSFEWNAFDGGKYASGEVRVNIDVKGDPDPPVLQNIETDSLIYLFGADSLFITESIEVIEPDIDRIESAVISITDNYEPGVDSLAVGVSGRIRSSFNAIEGELILEGITTTALYQDLIRTVRYYNANNLALDSSTPRTIAFRVYDGEDSSNVVTRRVDFQERFVDLEIPSGFTPNNDMANDTWTIGKIDLYPDVIVQVYTRRGEKVFESNGYSDQWDGTAEGGSELPSGVYYYFIDLNKFGATYKGTISILK